MTIQKHMIEKINDASTSYCYVVGEVAFKAGASFGYQLAAQEQKKLLDEV